MGESVVQAKMVIVCEECKSFTDYNYLTVRVLTSGSYDRSARLKSHHSTWTGM